MKKCFLKSVKENFIEYLKLNNLKAGISFVYHNPIQTQKKYSQAIYALKLAENLKIEGNLFYFEDYLEYYLIDIFQNTDTNDNKMELETLIHPLINQLLEIDKNNNTEMLKTLMTYLDNNRNANEASKALNIHCSTFFYRFHKMESLLNVSLNDSDTLFRLELSIKILKYQKYI